MLAAVFLHETLPAGTYAGLGLILAGLAVVVLGQRSGRAGKRPLRPGEEPPQGRPLAELGTD